MDNILVMNHITKTYPGVKALDDVSVEIKRGEVHALMGENGAGKSTLMKILSGVHMADEGEIIFDGKQVQIRTPGEALKLGISMIYQELSPIMDLTIAENIFAGVRFPRKRMGIVDWNEAFSQCAKLFEKWGLDYDPKQKMRTLSIADTQMIEIVKAISFDVKMIIMDEPSSALTEKEVEKLFEFIHVLKDSGITVIIITHKLEEVFAVTDTVTVLRDGKYIGTKATSEITREEMIRMMVGREIRSEYEVPDYEFGPTILAADNLTRASAVDHVSFELKKGEILGFSGIMGAGRTETMRCIFGLDRPESGSITLNGTQLHIKSPRDAIKNGIMMLTEDRKRDGLVLCRSIYENMVLPSTYRNSRHGFLNKNKEKKIVSEMFDYLKIKAPSDQTLANQLSGGNQQKVIIGKWLTMTPTILIMDEPTRGIDVLTKSEIYKLMRKLAKEGVSIILVSSDMEELLGVSDRIAVMCQGKITGILERSEFSQEKIMEYATYE